MVSSGNEIQMSLYITRYKTAKFIFEFKKKIKTFFHCISNGQMTLVWFSLLKVLLMIKNHTFKSVAYQNPTWDYTELQHKKHHSPGQPYRSPLPSQCHPSWSNSYLDR